MVLGPPDPVPKTPMERWEAPGGRVPPAFHVMLKPRGPICNLDCKYCFYLSKERLYEKGTLFYMSDQVLDSFTKQYLDAHRAPAVTLAFQGGEPTLLGLDFFRRAVAFQKKHGRRGMRIQNTIQTNGTLLNHEWCRFLKEYDFLVGLSLDGPRELHDAYRVDKGGHPTFGQVYKALKLLQRNDVSYNVLCVVNRINGRHPLKVYRFFKREGVQFIQFIPAVERMPNGGIADWAVGTEDFGEFMCAVFDEWVRQDVGRIYVQHFEVALRAWMGLEPGLCVHEETCGNCLALEHNGDLFSCDHFVRPDYHLGNITKTPLRALVASGFQMRFGLDKRDRLPEYCRQCPVLFACNGGCPKDRFIVTPDGEGGLNYLCAGYKRFFSHISPAMRAMAELLRRGQSVTLVTEMLSGHRQVGKEVRPDNRL